MGKYVITGGNRVSGEVLISGAKNAVLPILAALPLLEEAEIDNIPFLSDVSNTIKILENIGIVIKSNGNKVISKRGALNWEVNSELTNKMRSSILFLGSLLAVNKEVKIAYPGGCNLGKRPVDLHLWAMEQLGAEVECNNDYIICKAGKLVGCDINLPYKSVGVTENIILAAVLAEGVTIINNAAREPEIDDLCILLNKCGAKIEGYGSDIIKICGVSKLNFASHSVMPDRIEAATYLCIAAATRGELFVKNVNKNHIGSVVDVLKKTGCIINDYRNTIYIDAPEKLYSVESIKTNPYPFFPTDVQPQMVSVLALSKGRSVIKENIFSARYRHIIELNKMGGNIAIENNNSFIVNGTDKLIGADVIASDLRGGAALVIAGLAAEGITTIDNIKYMERGYEALTSKIVNIGGEIKKIL